MVLLVVILSTGRLVSAGRTMILLVVILPAGCFVSAGSYGLCCWFRVHAGGHTSAGGFISANRVYVPALVISEPPSKRQRVDSDTSQPSGVPAASTQHADDPDSAGGGSFKPAGLAIPMAGFAVPDTAGGT
ncbi:hypothetical protein Tco_0263392, partial [Tanacetum coccineum]